MTDIEVVGAKKLVVEFRGGLLVHCKVSTGRVGYSLGCLLRVFKAGYRLNTLA